MQTLIYYIRSNIAKILLAAAIKITEKGVCRIDLKNRVRDHKKYMDTHAKNMRKTLNHSSIFEKSVFLLSFGQTKMDALNSLPIKNYNDFIEKYCGIDKEFDKYLINLNDTMPNNKALVVIECTKQVSAKDVLLSEHKFGSEAHLQKYGIIINDDSITQINNDLHAYS